jgi:hypothetical protein
MLTDVISPGIGNRLNKLSFPIYLDNPLTLRHFLFLSIVLVEAIMHISLLQYREGARLGLSVRSIQKLARHMQPR